VSSRADDRERCPADLRFEGIHRADGRVGVRDAVLVLPSVICSHVVADRIADRVEGAVSAPHDHGCGQIGADEAQTRRTFHALAANPNVAGTVVVGLGCETIQSDEVGATLAGRDLPVHELSIQDAGGTDACIEDGVTAARALRADRAGERRPTDARDLTVGVVASDLGEGTIAHADPLVGHLVEEVVAAGGRAIVAGSERFLAHPEAARERVAKGGRPGFDALLERHADHPARASRVAAEARERGFEASVGMVGAEPVGEVLAYGERATLDSGVALVDAPSQFEEAATALAAAGAQVIVHVTADGVPAGHPIVPVLKVSGDPETVAALPRDVDIDATSAGPAALRDGVLATADGEPTCGESHGLTTFAITRVGPSM